MLDTSLCVCGGGGGMCNVLYIRTATQETKPLKCRTCMAGDIFVGTTEVAPELDLKSQPTLPHI